MKKLIIITLGLFLGFTAMAQPGYNWPEDGATREKAQEYIVGLGDDLQLKNYETALPKLEWLLANTPDLNKSVYINGAKVYAAFVKSSKGDAAKVDEYEDKTLSMYDKRIELFGNEASVLNLKGQKAWVYLKNRPEKVEEVFNLYKKIHELNGNKMYSANTVAYMDMTCRMKGIGKLNDEQVLEVYEKITLVLEANADNASYQKMVEPIDGKLAGCVEISCDKIKETYYPKFQANPELKMAKTIFRNMNTGGCTDDPVFFEMMLYIDDIEPSCGMKFIIAKRAANAKNYDLALKQYNKILETCGDEKKTEVYYEMARIYKKKGDNVTTRSYARKSIAAGSDFKSASYEMIGDMYFASFRECASSDIVKSRATYIAAFNQYKLAGNSKKMNQAKAQFPSAEEIFTKGMKEGTELTIACWINEKVILSKRPSGN